MNGLLLFDDEKDERFYTNNELLEHWQNVRGLEGVDRLDIRRNELRSFENYDRILGDYDFVLNAWFTSDNMRHELFEHHPNLKYMSTYSHGWEEFDLEFVKKRGVVLTNTIYGATTIAEHALALLFEVCRKTRENDRFLRKCFDENSTISVEDGKTDFWAVSSVRQIELFNKTIGIIGLGNIGFQMAKVCNALGMHVIAYSKHKKTGAEYQFIEQVSMEELLTGSDIISIHCPLDKTTYHLLDDEAFELMKDGVIIINTARGAIVDEAAFVKAIESGKVLAAGVDVLENEPPRQKPDIMKYPNVLITPHSAWITRESRYRVIDLQIENLKNFIEGHPTSVIWKI